ncbi:hypothetical protein [Streptomyces tardus]|uniref:hypothetical protein n=1 Tax=Streptomyces tardus TaxID=2780544 RepID=UPI0027E56998|nr:hypothetical protein [Streptomyces tardus]
MVAALALTVLVCLTAVIAWATRSDNHSPQQPPAAAESSAPATPPPSTPAARPGSVPAPPKVADPLSYAKEAAVMLWSYDTRDTRRAQQLAGMRDWMSSEETWADWDSVRGQVPDPLLWSRMSDQKQCATATASTAHFPSAFQEALAEDPAAITKAYVYFVTVTGRQTLSWAGDGGGAEERAVTLAVQCRPKATCSLIAIAPRVAP